MRARSMLFRVAVVAAVVVPGGLIHGASFIRGDADSSGALELTDAVVTLNDLFLGTQRIRCDDAADANDDGSIDIADPSYVLNFLFIGGPAPPEPFPGPGADPTADALACGPCADGPFCTLLDDRVINDAMVFRNGSPSIAVSGESVHVAFPVGTEAYVAHREAGGAWRSGPLVDAGTGEAAPAYWVDLSAGRDGDLAALIAFDSAAIWRRDDGGSWRRTDVLEGRQVIGRRHALARDGSDNLLAALDVGEDRQHWPGVGRRDASGWTFVPIGEPGAVEEPTLAVTVAGEPRLAFFDALDAGWVLRLGGPDGVESVVPLDSSELRPNNINLAFTTSEAGERVEFLVKTWVRDDLRQRLQIVRGAPGGPWSRVTVAEDDPINEAPGYCFEAPPFDGAICPVDYTTYHSVGVLEDADGAIRFLYSRLRVAGTVVARCPDEDVISCFTERMLEAEGDLRVAWLEGGELREQVIAEGVATENARATIDGDGRLHVACYDVSRGHADVRYLRFSP